MTVRSAALMAVFVLLVACSNGAVPPMSNKSASMAALTTPASVATASTQPPSYALYLPDGYAANPARTYPVLFVTDAPYAFPLIRSIARRVGDHGDGLRDFVLIGLSYAKGDTPKYSRNRDYTPTPKGPSDAESDMPGHAPLYGEAEGYRRFIAEEVFPFVASHYRVDMHEKIYAGHSYGGLLGVHMLLTDPGMFEHYILGSPSLQFDSRVMFERERAYAASHKDLPADVFMAVGAFESGDAAPPGKRHPSSVDMVRNVQMFERVLKSRHYPGLHIQSVVIGGEDHLTVFPALITHGLQAMLAPPSR